MATQSGYFSTLRRIAPPLLFLCGLTLSLGACSGAGTGAPAGDGPIVRLHPTPVDASAVQALLNVTAKDSAGQDKQAAMTFASPPFELVGVNFPIGTRGATTYQVSLMGDASCMLATGTATLSIDSDGIFDLPVTMSAVPLCGGGATLSIQVANVIGGQGKITSTPPGIDCASSGAGCTATFPKGQQIMLKAEATTGAFAGWSGGSCNGTAGCTLILNADTQIQGIFTTCHGWCKEQLPFGVTANLNGVAGTAATNVLIVGDAGTILSFNGSTWQPLTGQTANLYAATGKLAGSAISIAGDAGTMLQLSGGTLKSFSSGSVKYPLRAVAIGTGNTPNTYFVGDNVVDQNVLAVIVNKDGNVSTKSLSVKLPLYGISQNLANSSDDLFVVGALNGTRGFAVSWNGGGSITSQMDPPGAAIMGNIYAMLCGTTTHYAVGQSGMIVRRPSASGNGDKWMSVPSSTNNNLRGLWAGSESNIYAVGDGGTIAQYDGNSWTNVSSSTTNNLRAVWGSSPTNIYAVGDAGTILHYLP